MVTKPAPGVIPPEFYTKDRLYWYKSINNLLKMPIIYMIREIIMKNRYSTIGITLFLGILLCHCVANDTEKNSVSDISIMTIDSTEGIYLYIDNIPKEAMYLYVSLYDITTNDNLYTGTSFNGYELEQIKKTGILTCPFVKIGHEYKIEVGAAILTKENMRTIKSAVITTVAAGGISRINDPTLIWNNHDNIATLSAKPLFSNKDLNSQNTELRYGLAFISDETSGSVSVDVTNELIYNNTENFNSIIQMINSSSIYGDVSIYANVALSLEYKEIMWTMVFAKSESINLSL
jgi:hypothetical protein